MQQRKNHALDEPIVLPGGRKLEQIEVLLLFKMFEHKSIGFDVDPIFELKNLAGKSHAYAEFREDLTKDPKYGFYAGGVIASAIEELLLPNTKPVIIGIPTAGNGLAAACSFASYNLGQRKTIGYAFGRTEPKGHGSRKGMYVEGNPQASEQYFTIDNATTTGGSFLKYLKHMEKQGYPVRTMDHLVFVDRELGGVEYVRDHGFNVHVIYTIREVAYVFMVLGLIDGDVYAAVEREVASRR